MSRRSQQNSSEESRPFSELSHSLSLASLDEDKPEDKPEDKRAAAERLSAFYANATYDFYGTPSSALCVYKNGDAWPVRTGPAAWRIIREARGVHGHPMQAVWHDLGKRVYTLLDDMKVRWTSIDPVAFAEAGKKTFSPLLIWIGVEPASLAYEPANTAAEAVSSLLTQAGFRDFEIGFRESVVTRSAKMLSFDPLYDSVPEFRKPFTLTLGLSIAPLKTPHFEGTGALYFRESRNSNHVFLLTCAHVARPPLVYGNTGLARKTTSRPCEQVIALGNSGYTSALKRMVGAIDDLDLSIKNWQVVLRRLGQPQEGDSAMTIKRRNEHLALIENAKEKIGEITKFHDEISKHWTILNQRLIGEVIHVEPIDVNVAPHGFTRDWALIKLYDKFDWATFLGNKVYLGMFSILTGYRPAVLADHYIPPQETTSRRWTIARLCSHNRRTGPNTNTRPTVCSRPSASFPPTRSVTPSNSTPTENNVCSSSRTV